MQASNQFLSGIGMPYAGLSQKETNDKAGACLVVIQSIGVTYHSPANLPLPQLFDPATVTEQNPTGAVDMQKLVDNPFSWDTAVVLTAMKAATDTFRAAYKSGSLKAMHAAVDGINALAPVTKQPMFVPPSDLQMLSNAGGIVGEIASGVLAGELLSQPVDPWTLQAVANCLAGNGPASMQPTVFA